MAIVGTDQSSLPVVLTGQVPVVLGIALDHDDRRRLAAAIDGIGVLVFAPDLVTAGAVLDRHTAGPPPPPPPAPATPPAPAPAPVEPVPRVVRRGELEVDPARCRARWQDTPLALTQRERALLACLAAEPSQVWSYRRLYAAAWPGGYLDPGPVHAAVKRLRRKLREVGAAVRIEAVRGVGYELTEPGGH